MTRIGDDQFMHNFEQSTVTTPAHKTKAEEGAKGKGVGATRVGATDFSGNVGATGTVSAENLAELYLIAMETAYNSQSTDMMNKADEMQAQNKQAALMSDAESAITSAQLIGGNDIFIRVVPDDWLADERQANQSNWAFISQTEANILNNHGLKITDDMEVKSDDISSLTSSINDIEQTLSGNSEYTLLELQMDTQNLQQDSSLATSGLKTIGDAQSEAARNA